MQEYIYDNFSHFSKDDNLQNFRTRFSNTMFENVESLVVYM
jgi:hypothetical protein